MDAKWRERFRSIRILGLEPSPELLAIAMVNFVQGILGLSDLASDYFFKDTLQVRLLIGTVGSSVSLQGTTSSLTYHACRPVPIPKFVSNFW